MDNTSKIKNHVAAFFVNKLTEELIENPIMAFELEKYVPGYKSEYCPGDVDKRQERLLNAMEKKIKELARIISETYFED